MSPANHSSIVRTISIGGDAHPDYSSAETSDARIASTVNNIAKSLYWNNCATIIGWDHSQGYYDQSGPPS